MNWNRRSNSRAPSLMRGVLIASVEEIIRVVIVQRVEFILGADATVQRFSVLPELDVRTIQQAMPRLPLALKG